MYRCRTQNHTSFFHSSLLGQKIEKINIVFRIKYQKLHHQRHKLFIIYIYAKIHKWPFTFVWFFSFKSSGYQTLSDESHMLKKLVSIIFLRKMHC